MKAKTLIKIFYIFPPKEEAQDTLFSLFFFFFKEHLIWKTENTKSPWWHNSAFLEKHVWELPSTKAPSNQALNWTHDFPWWFPDRFAVTRHHFYKASGLCLWLAKGRIRKHLINTEGTGPPGLSSTADPTRLLRKCETGLVLWECWPQERIWAHTADFQEDPIISKPMWQRRNRDAQVEQLPQSHKQ